MKKLYFFAAIFSLSTAAFAQRAHLPGQPVTGFQPANSASEAVTPTDTLWDFFVGSPTIYGSQNGGFVVGINGYADKAKAQSFIVTPYPYAVEGALVWFGGLDHSSGSATSKVTVNVYQMNGTGSTSAGTGMPAPGTVLSSADILISDVDTSAGNMNVVTFSAPVAIPGDYAVGVDFTTAAAGDTVGIVSTADGDAGGTELSWEKWSDNSWHTMLEAWPLDIDFAIFPIVDMNNSIEEMGFTNGIKLGQNQPNPFNNTSIISYELENSSDVALVIYDLTGKMIQTVEAGSQMAGKHTIEINADNLAAGTYYYVLKTGDNNGIARKMVVGK